MPKDFNWRESWRNTWPVLVLAIAAIAFPWGLAVFTVVITGWLVYDIVT